MKIVVIGGRGLIGSKVATKLCAQGHYVKVSPTPSPVRMSWSTSPIHRCSTMNL
jgi:nucleoside-diphosphate-sugar epimerase